MQEWVASVSTDSHISIGAASCDAVPHTHQCNVYWEGNLGLHHGLSLGMWKHECRRLLSASSINLARKMDRGLADFRCVFFDSFLMHHVTCCNVESNGAETFACGGVNCRDRHFRHLKEGTA
eukprot:1688132-Amphidinium_carterae.2